MSVNLMIVEEFDRLIIEFRYERGNMDPHYKKLKDFHTQALAKITELEREKEELEQTMQYTAVTLETVWDMKTGQSKMLVNLIDDLKKEG